jgi:hypothetical protein
MRQTWEVDWGSEEVGRCDEGGPAAEEEEEVYRVGETPPVGEGADNWKWWLVLVYINLFIEGSLIVSSSTWGGSHLP